MNRPWMPLYVADYLADTAHLSAAEHGAYLLLIMHYWRTGGLPADDRQLSRIACMSKSEWTKARATVAAFFGDEWKHARIEIEIEKANAKHQRRQEAGKRGGIASANAKQKPSNAQASSSQSETQEKPKKVSLRAGSIDPSWAPSEEDIAYAISKGWPSERIFAEADRFRNNFLASGAKKKNWHATWCNWVTSPYQVQQKRGGVNGTGNGLMAAFDELIDRAGSGTLEGNPTMVDITPKSP